MSKLQDIITQAIMDGGLYAGQLTVNAPATTNSSCWGIYNPLSSGNQLILTRLQWLNAHTQPVQSIGVSSVQQGTEWLAVQRNVVGSAIPVPTVTAAPFHQKFGSNPNSAGTSPMLCLADGNYAASLQFSDYVPIGILEDAQPGVRYSLEDYFPLTTSQPIVLYPGDILNCRASFDLTFGGTIVPTIAGSLVYAEFVQVAI